MQHCLQNNLTILRNSRDQIIFSRCNLEASSRATRVSRVLHEPSQRLRDLRGYPSHSCNNQHCRFTSVASRLLIDIRANRDLTTDNAHATSRLFDNHGAGFVNAARDCRFSFSIPYDLYRSIKQPVASGPFFCCLLYTSPSPRD